MDHVFIYFDGLSFNNAKKIILRFSQEEETKKALK